MAKRTKGKGQRHTALMCAAKDFTQLHPLAEETGDVLLGTFTAALGSDEMFSWTDHERADAHQLIIDLIALLRVVQRTA